MLREVDGSAVEKALSLRSTLTWMNSTRRTQGRYCKSEKTRYENNYRCHVIFEPEKKNRVVKKEEAVNYTTVELSHR